jgi:hypothetical protein
MSGRFYGISVPSQQFLYQDMNGSTGGGGINGVGVQYIAPELARYGGIADAFMDHAYFGYESDQFFARQISAATYPSPVVALINSGYHAVVLNGGQWHKTTTSTVTFIRGIHSMRTIRSPALTNSTPVHHGQA